MLRAGGESGRFWQSCAGGKAPGLASWASLVPAEMGPHRKHHTGGRGALMSLAAPGLWGHCQRGGQASGLAGQWSVQHLTPRLLWRPWTEAVLGCARGWALAAPSLAVPPGPWCRRAFPSAQWLMTQRDTGWQEPWWVHRGTVSPDMGTVHLLWSGAALVVCTAEPWLLNQTHSLITASFSSSSPAS